MNAVPTTGTRRDKSETRRRRSNQQGAEEMEQRGAGARGRAPCLPERGAGEQARRLGSHQGGDVWCLDVLLRRIMPSLGRGHDVVLVVRHPLRVPVTMEQSFRQLRPIRGVLVVIVVPNGMRSKPQELRRRAKGKDEESGGENPAQQHTWIVAHWPQEVKPHTRSPAPGCTGPEPLPRKAAGSQAGGGAAADRRRRSRLSRPLCILTVDAATSRWSRLDACADCSRLRLPCFWSWQPPGPRQRTCTQRPIIDRSHMTTPPWIIRIPKTTGPAATIPSGPSGNGMRRSTPEKPSSLS